MYKKYFFLLILLCSNNLLSANPFLGLVKSFYGLKATISGLWNKDNTLHLMVRTHSSIDLIEDVAENSPSLLSEINSEGDTPLTLALKSNIPAALTIIDTKLSNKIFSFSEKELTELEKSREPKVAAQFQIIISKKS